MNYEDVEFLSELYSKVLEIEKLVKERGYEDRVMSAIVVGLMDEIESAEDESVEMKSLFSYNLDSTEELDIMVDLMRETFDGGGNNELRDMLGDLGISLN
tara:strand:- start:206 stop:505 length:300 start_codon:yes stop_codon:yes gene_type:complete